MACILRQTIYNSACLPWLDNALLDIKAMVLKLGGHGPFEGRQISKFWYLDKSGFIWSKKPKIQSIITFKGMQNLLRDFYKLFLGSPTKKFENPCIREKIEMMMTTNFPDSFSKWQQPAIVLCFKRFGREREEKEEICLKESLAKLNRSCFLSHLPFCSWYVWTYLNIAELINTFLTRWSNS